MVLSVNELNDHILFIRQTPPSSAVYITLYKYTTSLYIQVSTKVAAPAPPSSHLSVRLWRQPLQGILQHSQPHFILTHPQCTTIVCVCVCVCIRACVRACVGWCPYHTFTFALCVEEVHQKECFVHHSCLIFK